MQPDNADFDTADLRHASVRWYLDTSDGALAIGPSRVDPRTGEILDADIGVSQGWTRLPRRLSRRAVPASPMPRRRSRHDAATTCSACTATRRCRKRRSPSACSKRAARSIPNSPEAEAIVKAHAEGRDHARGRPHAGAAPQLPRLHDLHREAARRSGVHRARTAWAAR